MVKFVSEILSYAIIILIGIITATLALQILFPLIEKNLNSIAIQEAINNFKKLEKSILEVYSESVGSKRYLNLKFSRGNFYVVDNSIVYILQSKNLPFDDFSKKENFLLIKKDGEIFMINLTLDIVGIEGNLRLTPGNYGICILKDNSSSIKIYTC